LGFAVGPLVVAPLSEVYGRLWVYHVCNVCFLAFLVGCATSRNIGTFLACRFLSGCSGAAPVAIGGGTIADLLPPEERGKGMAIYGTGLLLGPVRVDIHISKRALVTIEIYRSSVPSSVASWLIILVGDGPYGLFASL